MRDNLTKKEIINSIYMQIGYSKKICEALIDDFFDILLENLIKNQKVKISGFGTFFLKKKRERIGRNPKTKEKADNKCSLPKSCQILSPPDYKFGNRICH